MCFRNRCKSSGRVLQVTVGCFVLMLSIQTAFADPVVVASDAETSGLEARNDPIRVGDGAVINGDIENRNGAIRLGDDVRVDGSIENRNGTIVIGQNSQADDVRTRNGAIRLKSGAIANDVETRNGRIAIEPGSVIQGSVQTRNGKISISEASIAKNISSRNGAIDLGDVFVGGDIRSHNGKIRVDGRSEVAGDVVIDLSELEVSGWSLGSKVELEIVISGDTQISGSVVLKLPRDDQSRHTGRIELGPKATVLGEVLVSDGVETDLRGEVRGGLSIKR